MPLHSTTASFWAQVEKTPTCWLWRGYTRSDGYGSISWDSRPCLVHRMAYEWLVGPIPRRLTIDHLCRVRHCVNPNHMEVVTNKENILRGVGLTARNAQKTHCLRGHPFDEINTYRYRGHRCCRICRDAATTRRRERYPHASRDSMRRRRLRMKQLAKS